MTWSPQQNAALKAVHQWLNDPMAPQVFRLFGYAGTGKTTLAKELASGVDGTVCFATFTGKAALVLRSKGCEDASTIHSLIYRVKEDPITGKAVFSLNRDGLASTAALIVIDEASMVDGELGADLLSFGKKVLVLGDPAQLPPVKGAGFFTECQPDFMLTEVHRQAEGNPIIRLSMGIREGKRMTPGRYGDLMILGRDDLETEMVTTADQVLVGMNKTRRAFNARLRTLQGANDNKPVSGDRLVCLKNDKDKGLLNGGIWRIMKVQGMNDGGMIPNVEMRVKSEDTDQAPVDVRVPLACFRGTENEIPYRDRRRFDEFDYGYALTVHKSQGSQWGHVVLFDESGTFRQDASRWLYTGVTRAAEKLTVVL